MRRRRISSAGRISFVPEVRANPGVIPANAGIQGRRNVGLIVPVSMDSRVHGDDEGKDSGDDTVVRPRFPVDAETSSA